MREYRDEYEIIASVQLMRVVKQSSSYPNFDLTVCGRLHDAEFNKNHIREAPVHFFTRRENLRRYRNLLAKTPDETVRSQLFIAKEERRHILQVISERSGRSGAPGSATQSLLADLAPPAAISGISVVRRQGDTTSATQKN